MAADFLSVGIVVAKRKLKGPWASSAWIPVAVLPAVPAMPPWTRLGSDGDDETFYAGSAEVDLHIRATAHYRDNLSSGRPSLWVALRPIGDEVELAAVTADPYEGEAMAESIGDLVEAVPMPSEVQAHIGAFFDAFHVEQEFFKRKRDRADPEALARRGPMARGEDEE
jgi:hypothetical protein